MASRILEERIGESLPSGSVILYAIKAGKGRRQRGTTILYHCDTGGTMQVTVSYGARTHTHELWEFIYLSRIIEGGTLKGAGMKASTLCGLIVRSCPCESSI